MATSNNTSVSFKLLIDTKGQKVLFAEASKEVVDFLFTLLSLPVSTVVKLLSKDGMVGCLGKLYESVEDLNDTYLQPNLNKDSLLKPKSAVAGVNILHLLTNESSSAKVFYACSYNHDYVSDGSKAVCPSCGRTMSDQKTYVAPPAPTGGTSSEGGYVKGVVTYMIMDNLEVKPMSTISSIAMLNKFSVKDIGALEEKVVALGMQEGLSLLKESLQSSSVLTNVFLGKKADDEDLGFCV